MRTAGGRIIEAFFMLHPRLNRKGKIKISILLSFINGLDITF